MKVFNLLLCCFSLQLMFGQTTASLQWVQSFGGADDETGQVIETDDFGNIYTLGHFIGTLDINPEAGSQIVTSKGLEDFYIQKRDSHGNFLWAVSMGGTYYDGAIGLSIDQHQNPIITGYFDGYVDFDPGPDTVILYANDRNSFVLKLSPSGSFKWVKQIASAENAIALNYSNAIATDMDNNIYITGHYSGDTYFDLPDSSSFISGEWFYGDGFINKYDSLGNLLWVKTIGGLGSQYGYSLAIDDYKNIYCAGHFETSIDLDPGPQEYIFSTNNPGDGFILKLDSTGSFVWGKQLKSTSDMGCDEIDIWNNTSIYVSGWFKGTADFDPGGGQKLVTSSANNNGFILKLNSLGSYEWHNYLSGVNTSIIASIDVDKGNNVYATGYFSQTSFVIDAQGSSTTLTSNGGDDIVTCRFNHAGNLIWQTTIGGTQSDYTRSIHVNKFNEVYTIGHFRNTVDFDPSSNQENKTSNGNQDVFIQKLGQPLISLKENSLLEIANVFPNPTSRFLNVKVTEAGTNLEYNLLDLNGQQLQTGVLSAPLTKIDLGNKPTGIYLLTLKKEHTIYTHSIILE